MYNEEKLNSRLSLYYEALAQEETLSDKEREKLYRDNNASRWFMRLSGDFLCTACFRSVLRLQNAPARVDIGR